MNAERYIQIVQFFFLLLIFLKLINSIFIELNLLSCFIYYSNSLAVSANREHENQEDESFMYNCINGEWTEHNTVQKKLNNSCIYME